MKKILVTGGTGYIGSHMVISLLEAGYSPIVIDDLSAGNSAAIPSEVPLYTFNIGNKSELDAVFRLEKIDAVMHFAASTDVGESVMHPSKFYQNNTMNTLILLDSMLNHQVNIFIFSSTAAIFGKALHPLMDEDHPKHPINPYGYSKLMCEKIIQDFNVYGLRSICLRYFNAAGADPLHRIKPQNNPRKNLIPIILDVVCGKRDHIEIFGRDYATPDGTCVRDYIHVMDLCQAHLLALESLFQNGNSACYNLGNGRGYSVQEIIDATKNITQRQFKVLDSERRPGDSPIVIADIRLAQHELNWHPRYPDIETMILHDWESRSP